MSALRSSASRGQENWCAPELMRLYAMQLPAQEQRLALTQALDKARQQQAYGWALRIAYSLATAQAESGENDAAMQLLQEALQDVDASDRATDVKNALALCARIER
jgi:hypothetical protein